MRPGPRARAWRSILRSTRRSPGYSAAVRGSHLWTRIRSRPARPPQPEKGRRACGRGRPSGPRIGVGDNRPHRASLTQVQLLRQLMGWRLTRPPPLNHLRVRRYRFHRWMLTGLVGLRADRQVHPRRGRRHSSGFLGSGDRPWFPSHRLLRFRHGPCDRILQRGFLRCSVLLGCRHGPSFFLHALKPSTRWTSGRHVIQFT